MGMGCFRRPSTAAAAVVVTILLLQACTQASSSPPHQTRKMLSVNASSPSSSGGDGLEECSAEVLEVSQSSVPGSWDGIPTYSVEFTNTCLDCLVCDVHVACGYFSSNDVIDPAKFRRLDFNDCLVNGGNSIDPSGVPVAFEYGNSFPYPMTVSSVSCNCT